MMPLEGSMTPSEGGILTSEGGMTPSEGGNMFSEGDIMPSEGGMMRLQILCHAGAAAPNGAIFIGWGLWPLCPPGSAPELRSEAGFTKFTNSSME